MKPDLKTQTQVIREMVRHYPALKAQFQQSGEAVMEYKGLEISFLDLQGSLRRLSPRKREAVYLNVILDKKQVWAARRMGISPASVGQYVTAAMEALAQEMWE